MSYKCIKCGNESDTFYAPTDPYPNNGYTCSRKCFEDWYEDNKTSIEG